MSHTISTKPQGQQIVKHSDRSHALLSASGASRWMQCTPSARLEEKYGMHTVSPYAAEGTLAHEIAELYIKHDILQVITDLNFEERFEKIMKNDLFNEEMLDVVPLYTDYCATEFRAAQTINPQASIEIEAKLDLTEFVPESFGIADCVIINDAVMEVIDLKYGKGVPVYAPYNKQGMLYALGALKKYDTLYDIHTIKITIVQPRINNVSTWEVPVWELLEWANNELVPAAKLAFAGQGELKTGEWCRFCSVKNKCRALYEENLELAKHDFADAFLLSDEEISEVLTKAPQVINWLKGLLEYAEERAIKENKHWPGFKLVAGRSVRKWVDEDKVVDAIFTNIPTATEDQIYDMKLKNITNMERTFGKKIVAEALKDVIIKPDGKPTLVPEDDKRPALGIEDAVNDFK